MTRFCKDCRECEIIGYTHSCRLFPNMVTGEPMDCTIARTSENMCGPGASKWMRRENIAAIVERAPITVRQGGRTVAVQIGDKIETDMATIAMETDTDIAARIKAAKPFDDYQ